MPTYEMNPLTDTRWDGFVDSHPKGCIFHTSSWLRALRDTYKYQPVVFTSATAAAPLADAMLLCEVNSWFTGRRLVSLPFSDHCDPLVTSSNQMQNYVEHLHALMATKNYRYIEIRPSSQSMFLEHQDNLACSESFLLHTLPLGLPIGELFHGLHKDCIQRKIRRAERESLIYVKGRADLLLRQFYQLLLRTRRRHSLPPQPLQWFRSLSACLGDRFTIHVAYKSDQAVAAIITLTYKETVTYKYGCSDERFANLGGTPFLFWKIIEGSRDAGALSLDLGRTDTDNPGLATFKERLGATKQELNYYRISDHAAVRNVRGSWATAFFRRAFRYIPDSMLVASGKLLYRHIG